MFGCDLVVLLVFSFGAKSAVLAGDQVGAQTRNLPPAYSKREEQTQTLYHKYTADLARAHDLLMTLLKRDASDLYKKLNPAPPKPVAYGYQILPPLTKDAPTNERKDTARATSSSYSWARTDYFIKLEEPRIETMLEQLNALEKVPLKERRSVYEKWASQYPELEDNQRLIDNHIQYNEFWQKTISEDLPRFDKLTKLHDAVLERQSLLDRPEKTPEMIAREKQLADMIHSQNDGFHAAPFIKLEHKKEHVWVLNLKVYTDIENTAYIRSMKEAIERGWTVEDRADVYRVKINFVVFHPKPAPARGAHLDVVKHVEKFPRDGGVMTTGVNSTFAIPARFVALGPQPISHNVLAHEFGHILGFVDGYFRGYRDVGSDGYEVLEIVPDPDDIMCTPGLGHVRKFHFEKIISQLRTPKD